MKTLKLVVSKPCCFGGVEFEGRLQAMIDKADKEGHLVCGLGYLHGVVEYEMGYDICACLNAEIFAIENGRRISAKKGIYDASLHGYEGTLKAYIWNGEFNTAQALIVDVTDEESVKYAEECYSKDQQWL